MILPLIPCLERIFLPLRIYKFHQHFWYFVTFPKKTLYLLHNLLKFPHILKIYSSICVYKYLYHISFPLCAYYFPGPVHYTVLVITLLLLGYILNLAKKSFFLCSFSYLKFLFWKINREINALKG